MSKPDKRRVGLQRKVSSVFKGVAIPGGERTGEPSPVPTDDVISTDAMQENGRIPTVQQCDEDRSPSISPEPEATQIPVSEGPSPVEKPADDIDPKVKAESVSPVSKTPQTAQSSLMKKLAQSAEPADTAVCPPSISAESEVAQTSATEQTVPDTAGDSAVQGPINTQTQQGSLMKTLAQSGESANEAVCDNTADMPLPTTPKRETSLDHRLKNDPKPPPASTAQNKHPLADSFVDGEEGGGFLQQIKEKLMPSEEEGGSAKNKVMVMLVPVLAIVMIFMFRQVLQKSPGKASAAGKKDKKVVAAAELSGEIEWKIPDPLPVMTRDPLQLPQLQRTENSDQATGPMNPGQGEDTTAAQIRAGVVNVRDIVYSEDKASALIGNRIVYAGSKIDGVTIVKINRDSVEFESNGETWVQRLRD